MQRIKYLLCALFIFLPVTSHALQVIAPVEGESTFVNISQKELNLISFPFSGIRAYTSSPDIDIKVQSRQVLINMTNQAVTKPQEVFFSTPYGTYLLMLVPKGIPAETIMLRIEKARISEAEEWEMDNDYIKRLKELVKSLYTGNAPNGYAVSTQKWDVSMWEGIEQTIVMTMTGAGLVGEIHEVSNHSKEPVRIAESEFYKEGVLAVSMTGYELKEGAKEQIFIVRRNMSSIERSNLFTGKEKND